MASSSGFAYAYEPSAVAIIDGVFEGNIDLRRNCSSLQTQFNALRAAQHSHHRLPKIVDRIFEGRVIENGRIMTLKDIVGKARDYRAILSYDPKPPFDHRKLQSSPICFPFMQP